METKRADNNKIWFAYIDTYRPHPLEIRAKAWKETGGQFKDSHISTHECASEREAKRALNKNGSNVK